MDVRWVLVSALRRTEERALHYWCPLTKWPSAMGLVSRAGWVCWSGHFSLVERFSIGKFLAMMLSAVAILHFECMLVPLMR